MYVCMYCMVVSLDHICGVVKPYDDDANLHVSVCIYLGYDGLIVVGFASVCSFDQSN